MRTKTADGSWIYLHLPRESLHWRRRTSSGLAMKGSGSRPRRSAGRSWARGGRRSPRPRGWAYPGLGVGGRTRPATRAMPPRRHSQSPPSRPSSPRCGRVGGRSFGVVHNRAGGVSPHWTKETVVSDSSDCRCNCDMRCGGHEFTVGDWEAYCRAGADPRVARGKERMLAARRRREDGCHGIGGGRREWGTAGEDGGRPARREGRGEDGGGAAADA
jgi:hypothetical protein